MKSVSFHHGGRLGDCLYAMYAVKNLLQEGEKAKIILTDFQEGSWDVNYIRALLPLLVHQDYVSDTAYELFSEKFTNPDARQAAIKQLALCVDYDLHDAELDYNPELFPEWNGPHWPGNCHIAKRYAVHFGLEFDPEAVWLTAPKKGDYDVVVHAPKRRLSIQDNGFALLLKALHKGGAKIAVIGGPHDFNEWNADLTAGQAQFICPSDMLEFAALINGAKVFVGTASSGGVIAEGLKKQRFMDIGDGCFNTYPYGETGVCLNEVRAGCSGVKEYAEVASKLILGYL